MVDYSDESTINSPFDDLVEAHREISLLVYHRDGANVVSLADFQPIVIGRSPDADITINDSTLSRHHARIYFQDDEVWIEDLHSVNGIRLNGRVTQKTKIGQGDEISLGGVTLALHTRDTGTLHGLESHDAFVAALNKELARTKLFRRPLSVIVCQSLSTERAHVGHWCDDLRLLLREPVDMMALYSANTVEIMLPELDRSNVLELTQAIIDRFSPLFDVRCGIAIYPESAFSTDEMVEAARLAVQRATLSQPIVFSPQRDQPVTSKMFSPALPNGADGSTPFIVCSHTLQKIVDIVSVVCNSTLPVLIVGETGTGKEFIAKMVHERSDRRSHPLITINCAAIPETLIESVLFGHERGSFTGAELLQPGVFESATNGTIFLDEIGELSLSAQAKLLRVLETKSISRIGSTKEIKTDVRVVAATHRNLEVMAKQNQLRWDLYYRLNAIMLKVPPLRERSEEIEPLADHFIALAAATNSVPRPPIDRNLFDLLRRYGWPGNVRELRNVIDRAVILAQGHMITEELLPERIRQARMPIPIGPLYGEETEKVVTSMIAIGSDPATGDLMSPVDLSPVDLDENGRDEVHQEFKTRVLAYEYDLLQRGLSASQGNKTAAARNLHVPLRTLIHKVKCFGLASNEKQNPFNPTASDRSLWQALERETAFRYRDLIDAFEKKLLQETLIKTVGNKTAAADRLNIPLRTLINKIKHYELDLGPASKKTDRDCAEICDSSLD